MKELLLNLSDEPSGLEFNDSFHGRGDVKITVFDRVGKIVEVIENHNLIVKSGRSELIKRLAGTSTLVSITKCSVGSGGAPVGTPFSPTAPVDADIALATPKYQKTIDTTTPNLATTNPQVTFSTTFDSATVNSLVNEAGLFFNDGTTMFARYTFKTVSLESGSGFSMKIDWTVQF